MDNIPSAAAQIIVTVIPIVGIVMGSVVVFFFLLWNHKQKKLLIEKGLYKKIEFDLEEFSLFTGLLLLCIGAGLTIFFILKYGLGYGVLGGLIPLCVGAGMILFFIISRITRK